MSIIAFPKRINTSSLLSRYADSYEAKACETAYPHDDLRDALSILALLRMAVLDGLKEGRARPTPLERDAISEAALFLDAFHDGGFCG